MNVAFVYEEGPRSHYDTTPEHFFFDALRRSRELNITYFPFKSSFDCSRLGSDFDFLLCSRSTLQTIDRLFINNERLEIPIVARIGDPHYALLHDRSELSSRIVYCFSFYPPKHFYRYYPKTIPYKMIPFGLEAKLYAHPLPFKQRIKSLILNSGAVNSTSVYGRLKVASHRILDRDFRKLTATNFYRLRTLCNKLPYVYYSNPYRNPWHTGDNYLRLLEQYRAAIAATTTNPSIKYLEVPAAGCLTFMEVTPENAAATYGFKDGDTAIFIDEKNYQERFQEYLSDPENAQWEQIANAGRRYVLENLTNDHAVSQLAEWLRSLKYVA